MEIGNLKQKASMKKWYKKDDVTRQFDIEDGKVKATIEIGGVWVSNPTEEQLLSDGWKEFIPPTPEPYKPTYAEFVEQYIRENGYPTYGAEFAIINNHSNDPTTYSQAYADYMAVRDAAKEWAKEQTGDIE